VAIPFTDGPNGVRRGNRLLLCTLVFRHSMASFDPQLSVAPRPHAFVLNRRINVESVMFRFLFLIESLRFFSGLFV
jgi:hypothetical protein